MGETARAWALTAEARPDYDVRLRAGGQVLRCYRHGQVHGLRVIEGETIPRPGARGVGSLCCGALTLPLNPPRTYSRLWYRKAGYLAVAGSPGHAVRVLRRRFF